MGRRGPTPAQTGRDAGSNRGIQRGEQRVVEYVCGGQRIRGGIIRGQVRYAVAVRRRRRGFCRRTRDPKVWRRSRGGREETIELGSKVLDLWRVRAGLRVKLKR